MKGWLVVNEFLQIPKFLELYERFQRQAEVENILLVKKTNAELAPVFFQLAKQDYPDFVLFWDKDIVLAGYLESAGIPVFNSSKAIEVCDNKNLTYSNLWKHGVPMPKTIPAPMTYPNIGYPNIEFLDRIERELHYPMICKEARGSFGEQVYLVHNREEMERRTEELTGKSFLFQRFVKPSFGKDLRLHVVGETVVAAMYRYSEHDFRANITAGGRMQPYQPSGEEEALAVAACRAVGADFAGVDLLFGEQNERLVCEVNSNAHFKNIEDCTGISVAGHILRHCVKEAFGREVS